MSLHPSVRPAVTFVYCVQTVEDIMKLLSPPDSPIIQVFDYKHRYLTPFSWEAKYMWFWKNYRFSTEIDVFLGNSTR